MVLEVKFLWIWILKLVNDFNNYENKLIKVLYMYILIICNIVYYVWLVYEFIVL